jgi:hypothetical protein
MFNKIKEFFIGKPAEVVTDAPYKVELPEPSPVAVQASEAMTTSIAPVAEANSAKKPAAKKAPRKPRTPKASK